ncbi:MAG: PepSY domain-containing protein [Alphaproteobacteria bacterium]|uniref:PepSY domain-containing protein n=1 Tax=Brevundimonas sp. TaxID=1871086 RepID=UPI001204F7BD|nr:PepSY domain-containing protein [Brevundimonas sp.]MBU3970420.1 PepSY domain-containing protein [Alphaproteobacteria bacterium]MBA3048760.1 hypothetical protein [Brevundimonas sp.]MBU4039545.1 PepSY domain-containing protein [Alphaproteobacteria bacterium]MBU4136275.1 PepSY domain-containing protein [Alphaproteobacteria bacterium]TAJ63401.1 MAG: hypothetical protein EPO49_07185 [Brevundimonas sp.]
MTRKKLFFSLSAAALISAAAIAGVAVAASPGSAGEDERDEIAAVNGARVSLAQAVAIAERQGSGKAMEASFDDENGRSWEVEIASGDRVATYAVDAASGAVSAVAEEADEANEGPEDND